MNFTWDVIATLIGGGFFAILVSTLILRLSCYLAREDVPGWFASLGIKVGALFVGLVFSGFVYGTAAAAARKHQVKLDAQVALYLFMVLANVFLNAGVYKLTMPWLSLGKSTLVVVIEACIGLVVFCLILGAGLLIANHYGVDTSGYVQEIFEAPLLNPPKTGK